jgi:DNA mismatch endonuclease (patch repair protein)
MPGASNHSREALPVRATPSYAGHSPASEVASRVGRGNTKKGTRPERLLEAALLRLGLTFDSHVSGLPGNPDIVFREMKVAVFCDGDFWHGRRWPERKAKLSRGANAEYWLAKIGRNRARDREVGRELRALGWRVVRVWESDVRMDADRVARTVARRCRLTPETIDPTSHAPLRTSPGGADEPLGRCRSPSQP